MDISQILEEYQKRYPIYNLLDFSFEENGKKEKLHPILILTQYLIDKLVDTGCKRVAVILPDSSCNLLPLILSKYFSNLLYVPDYSGSVLDDVKAGQHLRLGKAVVEFVGIDHEHKLIKFIVNKSNPVSYTCPINGIHHMFEKTEGAISSVETWGREKRAAEERLKQSDGLVFNLKKNRTVLKKSMLVLSAKNDFREFAEKLKVNGVALDEVISYGEIDLDEHDGFKLYNKGRLDCLPSVAVSTNLEEIYYLLRRADVADKIFSIVSTVDKFDEIMNNPDTLAKVLKSDIPFIVFVPESGFEDYPMLKDMGFELWHWKPSTIKSDSFLVDTGETDSEKGVFDYFANKVNMAALAEFKLEIAKNKYLKKNVFSIARLSQETFNADDDLRQSVRKLWALQNKLSWLICPLVGKVKSELENELVCLEKEWDKQRKHFSGQTTEMLFEDVFANFREILKCEKPEKLRRLEKFFANVSAMYGQERTVNILVPNRYPYFDETLRHIQTVCGNCKVRVQSLSDFYSDQSQRFKSYDHLVLTTFDKNEYVGIKQTYCYENFVFLLYDYENRWRENYLNKFDECFPHDEVKTVANKLGFAQADIEERPSDRIFADEDGLEEIADYNIPNTIIKSTLGNVNAQRDAADSLECIPIMLSEDKLAYFYPTHDLIDITALSTGNSDRAMKKDAIRLRKGDRILIRQSDKDIIREKADELMAHKGVVGLREKAELWSEVLTLYAENKTINEVCSALNAGGADCTPQQVRYWLSGETIMPRSKTVLNAIGKATLQVPELKGVGEIYLQSVDDIFSCGKIIQSYHQSAGRWLTAELKNKAKEIKTIAGNNPPHGTIEGIGEVRVYTVEDVLDKEVVAKNRINRIEDLY